jgi:formamidopyrimidine-DNA glycosylase
VGLATGSGELFQFPNVEISHTKDVSDEILYHAKLHPEQYSNTFTSAQLKQLHTSMLFVCQTAVDLLADSSKFPKDWLFNHRWGKGKKDTPSTLPNGDRITFLTVGGRTSCVIPNVQKKTGTVAADIKTEKGVVKADATEEPIEFQPEKAKTPRKRKDAPKEDESVDSTEVQPTAVVKAKRRKHDPEDSPKSEVEEVKPTLKVLSKRDSTKLKEAEQIESTSLKSTSNSRIKKEKTVKKELVSESTGNSSIEVKSDGRRRSGRISKPTV